VHTARWVAGIRQYSNAVDTAAAATSAAVVSRNAFLPARGLPLLLLLLLSHILLKSMLLLLPALLACAACGVNDVVLCVVPQARRVCWMW
jgi:hypothetical protein